MRPDDRLPDGWKRGSLGEIATILMGQSPDSKYVNNRHEGVPFLQGNAEFGPHFPTAMKWCSKPGRIVDRGDILMSVRAPVGDINKADREYCIGRGLSGIRVAPEDVDFIWYALGYEKQHLRRVSQGSTFDAINREDMEQFPILVPPAHERRRIGTILVSIDDSIDCTRAVIDQTRRLKTALLQDLLTNGLPGRHKRFSGHRLLGSIPEDWEVTQLSQVARVIDCKHRTPKYVDSGYAVVRPSDVKEGCLDLTSCPRTSKDEFEDLTSNYRPVRGDIVYSRNASFGVAAYTNTDEPFTIGQDVVIITGDNVNNQYLYYLLNSVKFQPQLQRLSAGSTFQRINLDDIRRYVVPVPAAAEQAKMVELLWGMDKRIEADESLLGQLLHTKGALSQGLLTGRIPVSVKGGA